MNVNVRYKQVIPALSLSTLGNKEFRGSRYRLRLRTIRIRSVQKICDYYLAPQQLLKSTKILTLFKHVENKIPSTKKLYRDKNVKKLAQYKKLLSTYNKAA